MNELEKINDSDVEVFKAVQVLLEKIDEYYWDGFDAAVKMVLNHIRSGGFFMSEEIAEQFADEILEEADNYKKDA